jgi:hypothetical protein
MASTSVSTKQMVADRQNTIIKWAKLFLVQNKYENQMVIAPPANKTIHIKQGMW